MTKRRAPWDDYKGKPIFSGDTIQHPDGKTGTVKYIGVACLNEHPSFQWRVKYDDGPLSRLCLQLGDKGQAVVVS